MEQNIKRVLTLVASLVAGNVLADRFRDENFFVGVNYWGSQAGIHMWRSQDWDADEIEKDISALKATGVEVLRVFPTWSEFQPIVQNLFWRGEPREFLVEGSDTPVYDPYYLDSGAMARFRFFCDTCKRYNVKLMVSLVTGWMSGRLFFPRALEGRNLLTDPLALMWEGRFARAFVRAMKDHPAIFAWDLGNECNCMGMVAKPQEAWNWLNTISSAIRLEDASRPVVSGMHSQSSSMTDAWNLQMQGELLDVLTPHPYPAPWRVDANRGPFNGFRNALHQVGQCLFYSGISGKDSFPQEVGNFGPTVSPDWMAAKGLRQEMFASWMHGLKGFLWWCAFEQMNLDYAPFSNNAMERELGVLKPDAARTLKPEALAIKEFKAFKDSLPVKVLPPRKTDAVCVLSEKEDAWQTSFGAFMLAKQAGFDLEFVAAETRELPDSSFYILPAGAGWESYTNHSWKRLLEKVEKNGATLLVSRGGSAGYSDWLRVTGLEQVMYREPRKITFEFDGVTMSASDDFTVVQTPKRCEVIVRDDAGGVLMSKSRFGKGRVIAINIRLEYLAMTELKNVFEGDFSNQLWRLYAYAAREAGVARRVKRADTGIVITEHPKSDGGTFVCALNTHDHPVDCPIIVNGTVGRSWNGQVEQNHLRIRENDGCLFEIQ